MLLIDDLLLGGFRFVLQRLVDAVDSELTDDTVLKEDLLAAQMRLELGEISDEEFREIETDLLQRIREVRERKTGPAPAPGTFKVTGVEATVAGEEHEEVPPPSARRR